MNRIAWTVALLGPALFATLAWGIQPGGPVPALDARLAQTVAAHINPATLPAWATFTHLGDTATQWALATAATLALGLRLGWRPALGYAVLCATGGLWIQGLKLVFDRVRPQPWHELPMVTSGASFPSGHSMGSMVVFGALLVLVWPHLRPGWPRALALVLAVGAIAGIGTSRVVLGVHWPSDVLAGWALGAGWVAVGVLVRGRWGGRS